MKVSKTTDGHLYLNSKTVSLGKISPVINGISSYEINPDGTYRFPTGERFGIEISESEGKLALKYWLENSNSELASFGIRFEGLGNLRGFLQNGYFSWDGSAYIELETDDMNNPYKGYAMTQLLPRFGQGSVVIGFDRHDRFQHTFTFDVHQAPLTLTIETLWDEKPHSTRCESEHLLIFEHPEVENALREWARLVAEVMSPRKTAPHITGWCSWYNLYAYISEDIILEHLHGAAEVKQRENLPLRVFQIDDGFTPEMGDWLEVKPQFPRGMKSLLDDIRSAGFIPGLWIAPFMVGNRSHLYREHPDWVVRERDAGKPLAHMKFYEEFRWHKRSEEYYILDVTHPDALEYMRQVFRTWRYAWGCEYFKTDFMHFGSEHGPERAVWHQSGLTRIEIWRRMAEAIREEIGDALWLGCGCPLWASIGLVDAIRIGGDVGVKWAGNQSAQSLLRDQATRNFGNHILWQIDPDCILLREQFHYLTELEVEALAIYAGMSSGLIMTSDALHELSPERIRLFKLLLNFNEAGCELPLLGRSKTDPVSVQVRRKGDQATVFILNTSDYPVQRTYPLERLNLPQPLYAFEWTTQQIYDEPLTHLNVSLLAHQGMLWFLAPHPFGNLFGSSEVLAF